MARTKRANPFETRSNREKHLAASKYHWTPVDEGIQLGYRRGMLKSMWFCRRYVGGKKYEQKPLAAADDYQDADGRDILTYFQASNLAKERATESREQRRPMAPRGGHTVKEASDEYLARLEAEGKKSIPEIRRVLEKDILPRWGSTPLQDITESLINNWITALLGSLRKTRGGNDREIDDSPEGVRKRRATAQRKWTVLRSVLNVGRKRGWVDGRAWADIANLKNIDPPVDEFPTVAECKRLIRRTPAEFRPVVEATFLTGAAYSELTSMTVRDYTPNTRHVRVYNSKRQDRFIPLTDDGIELFDSVTAGKGADELIFTHRDGRPWQKSEQKRPIEDANEKAKLDPPITLTRLRKTYGSLLLNAGVPLETVAQAMGHSDTRVTRKHYARLLQGTQ